MFQKQQTESNSLPFFIGPCPPPTGTGTIALDPTFGSFTLLEPVSHYVNQFLWWKCLDCLDRNGFFWCSECGHSMYNLLSIGPWARALVGLYRSWFWAKVRKLWPPKVSGVLLFEKTWIEHIRPLFSCILDFMNKHLKSYERTPYLL